MAWTENTPEHDEFAVTIAFQNDVGSSGGASALLDFVMRYAFYAALTVNQYARQDHCATRGKLSHLLHEIAKAWGIVKLQQAVTCHGPSIFLMVVALIVKLMWNCNEDEAIGDVTRATENSRLLLSKDNTVITYGTSGDDLETSSSSSSDDLYDGKICVICYDDQKNCFFIPCGHCVACYTCAHRIINEESKSCPICRGIIDKVRKLHIV